MATGFCPSNGQPCHRFVTVIDEFGSLFDNQEELTCFRSIVAYANNEAESCGWHPWSHRQLVLLVTTLHII